MDPTREPREILSDDAVVAFLREHAPGVPAAASFDARAITVRASDALRRLRRRRLRTSTVAVMATAAVYFTLALAGPLIPGGVNVPGGNAIRGVVAAFVPGLPPAAPDARTRDVDRLEADVLPVIERLQVTYYLRESKCRVLEYGRGHYSDQANCGEMTPFDAQATADFNELTAAVERSGVTMTRIGWDGDGAKFQLPDSSWQYNWEYVYRPYVDTPPAIRWPGEEQWTRIRGHWWFHRTHDD